MKKYVSIVLFIASISSCFGGLENSKTDKTENQLMVLKRDSIEAEKLYPLSGCYEMIIDKDTALMNITHINDSITGNAFYNRNDKVNSNGIIKLIKINNRIEGWYSYQSQGKFFVREKVFKINQNKLAEGYGEIEMKKDSALFKYPHALNFELKHTFNKVNCK